MSKIYIVTGASRGLGRALAEQLLQPGHHVLAIARREAADLARTAAERGVGFTAWSLDLADAAGAARRLAGWLAARAAEHGPADAALINNAAALSEPAPLADSALDELANATRVGLEAPLLLTAAFLHATESWATDRRVLNVSSGLGRRAMAGSASYCAIKAGMDHFTRCVALEEAAKPDATARARVASVAPGIIDTDMQAQLRNADRARFPDGAQFESFKAQGQLATPDEAAAKLLRLLSRADFGAEPVTDVRQA